jgi:hypothetical protein
VSSLVREEFLIHVLEEQKSSFEEILVDVAESGSAPALPPLLPVP